MAKKPAPAPTPPPLPLWKCQLSSGVENGLEIRNALTVGQVMAMDCTGESVANLAANANALHIDDGRDKSHALKIIKIKSFDMVGDVADGKMTATGGHFDVVSYEVGEHKQVHFVLTDGTTKIQTEPLSWTVKTVIQPDPSGKPPEPFGPFGPWKLTWPLWWWGLLIGLLLLLAISAWRQWRRISKRRQLVRDVREYRNRHFPFDEFQKELRQMQRKLDRNPPNPREFLKPLSDGFRIYIRNTLIVAADKISDRAIRRHIWRNYRTALNEKTHQDISKFLQEVKRADREDISLIDVTQLVEWAQNLSEDIDAQVENKEGARS